MEDGDVGAHTVLAVRRVGLEVELDEDLATIHHQGMEEGIALEVPITSRLAM